MVGSGKDSAASEKETAPVRPHKLRPSYFGDSCRGATRHGSDCELKFWLSGGLFRGTQREGEVSHFLLDLAGGAERSFPASILSGIVRSREGRCNARHGHQIARGHLGRP